MKMDRLLISKEDWELGYLTKRFEISKAALKSLVDTHNNSRRKVYAALKLAGHIDTKLTPKQYENKLR